MANLHDNLKTKMAAIVNMAYPATINPFGRGFHMAALNINSLLAHFYDLKFFVLNSKTDVLAINETKIDSSANDN